MDKNPNNTPEVRAWAAQDSLTTPLASLAALASLAFAHFHPITRLRQPSPTVGPSTPNFAQRRPPPPTFTHVQAATNAAELKGHMFELAAAMAEPEGAGYAPYLSKSQGKMYDGGRVERELEEVS